MAKAKGTWNDPAIISDPRIDHKSEMVRAVAERLHSNESLHLHSYVDGVICPYCALRTTRVLRWAQQHSEGRPMGHDTPFGFMGQEAKPAEGTCERCGGSSIAPYEDGRERWEATGNLSPCPMCSAAVARTEETT